MKDTNTYLENNLIVRKFVDDVNAEMKRYYAQAFPNLTPDFITISVGTKFIKLKRTRGVWGFIARCDGYINGVPYRRGDLLMAATYSRPAKHARGNIIDGTAKWDVWGPKYLAH